MKKISILFLTVILGVFSSIAQPSINATLKPGALTNSVMIAIRSNSAGSGSFTNVQFTLQIPNTISPQPVASVRTNPMSTYIPVFTTEVRDEGGFYNYLFAASPQGAPVFNFTANTEVDVLEVVFNNSTGPTTGRLAHLPSGGTTGNNGLYIEMGGIDFTNYPQLFYGPGASNAGIYEGYSFVPLSNLGLPVTWLKFEVAKRDNDAVLNWIAANEDRNKLYEVERSSDGRNFTGIGTVQSKAGNSTSNDYSYIDENVSGLKIPVVYYRLKQVDIDGKFTYSKIYSLRYTDKSTLLSLYPNPARNQTVLSIDLNAEEKISITIIDATGKLVYSETKIFGRGLTQHRLNIGNFKMGHYEVKLKSVTTNKAFKLIVQ